MRIRSAVSCCVLALVAATGSASAQEADTSSRSIEDVRQWLSEKLPKYGDFPINLTADWANVGAFRATEGSNRSVEARHQIRNVALENCQLRYRGELRIRGSTAEPLHWETVLPLASIDVSLMRIQRYVLPRELRSTTPRSEVYLRAVAASPGFSVTDQDRRTLSVWEHSIPVDRSENAAQLVETLKRGARLCGGS